MIDWSQVGDAIKAGRYNLLLGAGVSLDSVSGLLGLNCPSAGKLRDDLQAELPNVRPGSSLNRLYRTMDSSGIDRLITKRFVGCTAGATVKTIARFRWRRIFTLNVDDALENAYETADVASQSIASLNFDDPYAELRDLRILPIIHLHGFARRPQAGYVFDIKEYTKAITDNNIWAHVLGSLIRTEPFIVLGTSLEESDLTYFLADRNNVTARPDRPPSILVEPFADQATAGDCAEYALSLFEGTSLQFLQEIEARFPVRPSVDDAVAENLGDTSQLGLDPVTLAEFHSDFERVPPDTVFGPDGGPNFAYGHQATWFDVQSNRDIPRVETSLLQNRILQNDGTRSILIEGGAGSGKSTLLRHTAWNLAQAGHRCYWLRSVGRLRSSSLIKFIEAFGGASIIFVDNFADNVNEIAALARHFKGKPVTFVGAERSYRMEHIRRIYGNDTLKMFSIGSVGAAIANQLTLAYQNYGLASSTSLLANSTPLSNEFIAIACCRILNNFDPLDRIIDRSVRDAPERAQNCYVFAALASHCYRQGVEYDLISQRYPDYQVDIQTDDSQPLPLKLLEVSGAEFITPLNEAVSDSILKRFSVQFPDRLLDIFTAVAKSIRPRVNIDAIIAGEPSCRLASRLFDYDEVVKPFLGPHGAGVFYENTKREWEWNSRYWHQIAQYRLDLASLESSDIRRRELVDLAVQHAKFSKTIEPNHQFTMTTIGRILFGKMRVLNSVSANDLDEAIKVLGHAIRIEKTRRRVTVHPFMILFKGVMEAIALGAWISYDQKGTLLAQIRRSFEEFPGDRELAEEGRRLQSML